MAIDVQTIFAKGGRELLGFLSFCVMSYRMEPLFAFFHREYSYRPTPERALVLYDCFCAPNAPARMRGGNELLPPRNVRFAIEMEDLRARVAVFALQAVASTEGPAATGPDSSVTPRPDAADVRPPGILAASRQFDQLVARLSATPGSPLADAGRAYDPALSPAENLPGGRMSPAARAFVDNVWRPRVAPVLVHAGFRHASNLA